MSELILILHEKDKDSLSKIRCSENIQIAVENELIWVKGITEILAHKLPAQNTYLLDQNNYLFPLGSITPTGKLKELKWIPINEFIKAEFPISLLPGIVNETYMVKLVPSDKPQKSNALFTDFYLWENYVNSASEIRLNNLIFSVSETKQVIIIGDPLPPIPGEEYWIQENILLPCGYSFEMPIIADLISDKLNPEKSALLLFEINGEWEKIFLENLVPATRSAVRLTNKIIGADK